MRKVRVVKALYGSLPRYAVGFASLCYALKRLAINLAFIGVWSPWKLARPGEWRSGAADFSLAGWFTVSFSDQLPDLAQGETISQVLLHDLPLFGHFPHSVDKVAQHLPLLDK